MLENKINYYAKQAEQLIQSFYERLRSSNFQVSPPDKGQFNFNFKIKRANSTISLNVFYGKKGIKIILQGNANSTLLEEINQKINIEYTNNQQPSFSSSEILEPDAYIGVDESGKGDFFGPLIIAGFYVNSETKSELKLLKVQDSKNLTDERVIQIASSIKEKFKDYFSIVRINPKKYNYLYQKMGNLNLILAWGHSRCIENILIKHRVPVAICDQFGNESYIKNALMKEGKQIELIQTTKAERFIGVAAASILARDAFIEWIRKTEQKIGLKIPKGVNHKVIESAKLIVNKSGRESLAEYVKLHFKTINEI